MVEEDLEEKTKRVEKGEVISSGKYTGQVSSGFYCDVCREPIPKRRIGRWANSSYCSKECRDKDDICI